MEILAEMLKYMPELLQCLKLHMIPHLGPKFQFCRKFVAYFSAGSNPPVIM